MGSEYWEGKLLCRVHISQKCSGSEFERQPHCVSEIFLFLFNRNNFREMPLLCFCYWGQYFFKLVPNPWIWYQVVKPEAKLHHWICCMSSRGCFSLCKVNRSMKCVLFLSQTLPSSSNYWRWKVSIGCVFNITLSNVDPFKTSSWQVIIIVPIIIGIISIVGAGDLGNEFQ